MSAPGASGSEQGFYEATQNISRGLEEVRAEFRKLAERLDNVLPYLFPRELADGVRDAYRELLDLNDRFMNLLQRFIEEPGYPPALFRIGDMWETAVGAKLSERAALMAPDERAADDSFIGSAARAYKDAAEAQRLAAQSFMPLSTSMKSALHEVANAQILFLAAMGAAIGTLAVGLATAAVSAGSVVGAPAAPGIAAGAAGAAITMLLAAAPILYDAYANVKTAYRTMESEIRDAEGLPDNHWPTVGPKITDNAQPWQVATD